jgi:hypothetical protein
MDARLRQLERAAQSGDQDAMQHYKAALVRISSFVPKDETGRRTLKRWRAHQNLTCNDKCRFCRRTKAIC